ncbi:hypothetical protein ABH922_002981 [Rhodococcus sp. 27YEA15]|uniref:peptidoglycan-binding protein n=1 Tax=Rhodococcus sp. 27YEA15 TaxID=3156259 RepID=UPI003C7B71EA
MSFRSYKGNTITEAGWRICDRNECEIVNTAPFMNTAPLRKGAPAIILGALAKYLHENVRPFTSPVWGWSAENSLADSNHLGGVSLDFWAPIRPMGRYTMPANEVAATKRGLELFPEVFWGRAWTGNPDEMHFQMRYREGDPRNDAGVRRIVGGAPSPTPPTLAPSVSRPTLMRGATGVHVSYLQALFNRAYPLYSKLAVDGDFGPATEAVTREFQRRSNLAADGIVGPATWRALGVK